MPDAGARPTTSLFATNESAAPDFDSAIMWARKAADGGSADGQAVLGYILTSGPDHLRNLDEAGIALRAACRQLDKAASKGVIHKNQAANRKSAIAKRYAELAAS